MLAEAGRNPVIAELLQKHTKELRSLLAKYLKKAQQKGQVDPTLDCNLTASLLLSIVDGATSLTLRDPKMNSRAGADMLRTLITRFLAPSSS